jgi:hypothetical protein
LKLFVFVLFLTAASCLVSAQQSATSAKPAAEATSAAPEARPADVDTVDHIIVATYDVISGPAGTRDWNRFRSLFYPDARLIGSGRRDGKISAHPRTVDGYIQSAGEHFKTEGFYERGIHNEVEQFDHMAQVWSTYEARKNKDDAKPFVRGINSFQLLYDGSRWWIVNIYWQSEDAAQPIPAKYLP